MCVCGGGGAEKEEGREEAEANNANGMRHYQKTGHVKNHVNLKVYEQHAFNRVISV